MAKAQTIVPDDTRPEDTYELVGHGPAEQEFLDAYNGKRLAHAWLITGSQGIGKATLAFRVARFLLAQSGEAAGPSLFDTEVDGGADALADSLYLSPDHRVSALVRAGSHPNLAVLRRTVDPKSKKLRSVIIVDDVRDFQGLFAMTAADGGWRVAIIDPADDMNRNAANALLKLLEEPPPKTLLLLVSHAPGRLLPTIRSRCRRLALHPLGETEVSAILEHHNPELSAADRLAVARFAGGSPGRAITLASQDGLDLYRLMVTLLSALPNPDTRALHALGDRFRRKDGADTFKIFTDLLVDWLQRMVRAAASGQDMTHAPPEESAIMARLSAGRSLDQWVEVWENVRHLIARADAINLDRKQVLISMFSTLEHAAKPAA